MTQHIHALLVGAVLLGAIILVQAAGWYSLPATIAFDPLHGAVAALVVVGAYVLLRLLA